MDLFLSKFLIVNVIIIVTLVFSSGCGGFSSSSNTDTSINNHKTLPISSIRTISPTKAVRDMKMGINLGNTLDAYPNEGDWAPKAEKHYFSAFREAGFKHVRIPITWDSHTGTSPPYTISKTRMDRVAQVIDWALSEELYVVINAHHESWLKKKYNNQNYKNRFDSIWQQISKRYKDKSPKLIFEILNEPTGMTIENVNELNQRVLNIIRRDNPTRLVVFSGNSYTSIDSLMITKPLNDNFVIGNIHVYTPWDFAGLCKQSWGDKKDIHHLKMTYQKAYNWSKKHSIPITINEFGVAKYDFKRPGNICNKQQRIKYLKAHVRFAKQYEIATTIWDDGGAFSLYNRSKNTWSEDKDIIIH